MEGLLGSLSHSVGSGGSLSSSIHSLPPMPTQEYFLQSSISQSNAELLITRLRGICDKSTTLHEREVLLSNQGVSVRLRSSCIPHSGGPKESGYPVLRYLAAAEMDKPVMRRTCLEIPTSPNISQLLKELGFRTEAEFRYDGHAVCRGRVRAFVYEVYEAYPGGTSASGRGGAGGGGPAGEEMHWRRVCPRSLVVELSGLASPGDETVIQEVLALSEQLKPLLNMTKIDHAKFHQNK